MFVENSADTYTSSLASVGRGALFFGLGRFSSQIISFITLLLLTNFLGTSKFGVYSFGLTVVALIGTVANVGADKGTLRFLPANPTFKGEYISISYIIGFVGSWFSALVLFIFSPMINKFTLQNTLLVFTLRVFAFLILTRVTIQLTTTAYRAENLPEYDTFLQQLLLPILKLFMVIVAIILFKSYITIIIGLVVVEAIISFVGMYVLIFKTSLEFEYPKNISIKKYLSFSLPASIKDASSLLFSHIDIFMIGFFVSSGDVGIYRVAIVLGTLISLPLASMKRIFPSITAKLYHNNQATELIDVFNSVTRWVIALTVPILLVFIIYRFEILSLFGPDFTKGTIIFVILLSARFIQISSGVISEFLLMTDNQNIVSINQIVFGSINIFLNLILIPQYGLLGAALATFTSMSLHSLTRVFELLILRNIRPYSFEILRIVPAVFGMAVGLIIVQMLTSGFVTLLAGGVISSGIYLILLYRFGMTKKDEQLYQYAKENNPLFQSL
ncbi:MAG: oligosaccharide flippase family protein [Candidatus Paceibacteria bacterium]